MKFSKLVIATTLSLSLAPVLSSQAAEGASQESAASDDQAAQFFGSFFWDWFGLGGGHGHSHGSLAGQLPAECDGETFPTTNRECMIALAQEGGYVLYTRHVRTETDFADQDDPNFNIFDCNQQRKVSAEGYQQATELRNAIQEYGIEVKKVISSQFCRAWQTAIPMYGKLTKQTSRLNFIQEAECQGQSDLQACLDRKARRNVTPLLSKRVSSWGQSKNRALVAHDDPFKSTTGYYPYPMGSTYIIKPKGQGRGFEVMGCIAPDAWFGGEPAFQCNLDASLTADDFDEGVPDGTPLEQ